MRKVFVIANAIIGVITVLKVSGFSTDNLLAGIYGLGFTYMEMFTTFCTRLFNWFLNLLDYKIVPNVPNVPNIPNIPPIDPIDHISNQNDKYKYTWHDGLPSYIGQSNYLSDWSIPTWLWYTGAAIL